MRLTESHGIPGSLFQGGVGLRDLLWCGSTDLAGWLLGKSSRWRCWSLFRAAMPQLNRKCKFHMSYHEALVQWSSSCCWVVGSWFLAHSFIFFAGVRLSFCSLFILSRLLLDELHMCLVCTVPCGSCLVASLASVCFVRLPLPPRLLDHAAGAKASCG